MLALLRYLLVSLAVLLVSAVMGLTAFAFDGLGYRMVPMWPIAGIALYVAYTFGWRYAPVIFLSFLLSYRYAEVSPLAVEVMLSLGGTMGALVGAALIRWVNFRPAMDRVHDVFLLLCGAVPATFLSTLWSYGVLSWWAGPGGSWAQAHWLYWWAGDIIGILVLSVPFFVWTRSPRWSSSERLEFIALLTGVLALGSFTFFRDVLHWSDHVQLSFMVFPFLVWSGIRFGPHGSSLLLFVIAFSAVLAAFQNGGFFIATTEGGVFVMLQTYLTSVIITGIALSSASAEQTNYGAKLEKMNHELKQAVDAARKSAEEAQRANESKSRFLAMMSHELRTPLNGVLGFTNLLLESPLNTSQQEYVRMTQESGESLLHLIDDILDFNRIDAGRFRIKERRFDLARLCDEVFSMFEKHAREKGLAFRKKVADEVPQVVVGDSHRIRQILVNLIGNAIKFTEKGGIEVGLAPFEEQTVPDDDSIGMVISVADTGIGIDPQQQDYLFNPFAQANAEISSKFGGTGLGLAVCKHLCELMGGRIWFDSEPNEGSTFYALVRLKPSRTSSMESSEVEHSDLSDNRGQHMAETHPLKLLLMEDNLVNQKVMRQLLHRLGYELAVADNGVEGLKRLQAEPFDLVLMDLRMPEMDGYETTRSIREGGAGPDRAGVRIVAVTAFAMVEDKERCLEAGMDGHLSKPVTLAELTHVLREAYETLQKRTG